MYPASFKAISSTEARSANGTINRAASASGVAGQSARWRWRDDLRPQSRRRDVRGDVPGKRHDAVLYQMGLGASGQCEKGTIRLGATGSDGASRTPHAKRQGNPLAFRWLVLC